MSCGPIGTLLPLSRLQCKTQSRTLLDTPLAIQGMVPYLFPPQVLTCITGRRDSTPIHEWFWCDVNQLGLLPTTLPDFQPTARGGFQLGPRGGCQVVFDTASSAPGCGIESEDWLHYARFLLFLIRRFREAPLVQLLLHLRVRRDVPSGGWPHPHRDKSPRLASDRVTLPTSDSQYL